MDPVSIIVAALVAGAASAAKDTASRAVKDAYEGLKALIKSKFSSNTAANAALDAHADDPKTWDTALRKSLSDVDSDQDTTLIESAQSLLKLADPEGTASGKYSINVTGNIQGLVQGDNSQVTMHFGTSPDSNKE